MHAVPAPVQADVQTELDDWRGEHRRGPLGYHVFDGIPEGTIRAVCMAYNARARLTDAEAIKAVATRAALPRLDECRVRRLAGAARPAPCARSVMRRTVALT